MGTFSNWGKMAGWMTCDFRSFSTVFHSYQDNGLMNEREYAMEPGLQLKRSLPFAGLKPRMARSEGQRLSYCAKEAPFREICGCKRIGMDSFFQIQWATNDPLLIQLQGYGKPLPLYHCYLETHKRLIGKHRAA